MNMREYDIKIKAKEEILAKMQEDLDKRQAKMDKVRAEIKQLQAEQEQFIGQGMMGMMTEMGIVTPEKRDEMMAQFKKFMIEYATTDEETVIVETVPSNENESLSDTSADETEYLADEPTEEIVDGTEEITEDFETDDTSSYSKSVYYQNRNSYRNNNS